MPVCNGVRLVQYAGMYAGEQGRGEEEVLKLRVFPASPRALSRAGTVSAVLLSCAALVVAATAYAAPTAVIARTISLNESAHLHSTGKPQEFYLNEEGSATGTIKGTIYIHLHIANNHGGVTAEVNIYPHGGSLSGHGSANYQVEGADAAFSGKLTITRGTGSYSGAHASNLRFTGTITRRTDAVAVQLSGSLSV
jgi:hypothetical protein